MPSASQGITARRLAAPPAASLPTQQQEQGAAADGDVPIVLQYGQLVHGQLVRRYKRFLGDVRLEAEGGAAAAQAAAAPIPETAGAAGVCDALAGPPSSAAAPTVAAAEDDLTTVHVPNTGPMTGLLGALPAPALLSVSNDPKRKYRHTLEWLRPDAEQGSWVGTHSAKANAMVRTLLEARLLPGLPPYSRVQAEVRYGADGKSRVDFVLLPGGPDTSGGGGSSRGSETAGSGLAEGAGSDGPAKRPAKRRRSRAAAASSEAAEPAALTPAAAPLDALAEQAAAGLLPGGRVGGCFLEVKSVTLAEDLEQAVGLSGHAAVRPLRLEPIRGAVLPAGLLALANQKDPVYGQLVREAAAAGVALLPVVCCLDEAARAVRYRGTLPVDLDYKWKAN